MPPSERAKQFAPFAAIRGLGEALRRKEAELAAQPMPELSEDEYAEINRAVSCLVPGSMVRLRYYSGGAAREICAKFLRIDSGRICLEGLSLPLDIIISADICCP